MRATPKGRTAGFTLLEIAISVVLMTMILGSLSAIVLNGSGAFHQGITSATLESRARRGLDRIAAEFSAADRLGLAPAPIAPLGSETLDYRCSIGAIGGTIIWGPNRRLVFQNEPSDPNDGVDNDNDGLIDEGRVVLIEDLGLPTQQTRTVCTQVREFLEGEVPNGVDDNGNGLIDEQGLSFELVGETLVIRLTLEKVDNYGRVLVRTVETSVWIRN